MSAQRGSYGERLAPMAIDDADARDGGGGASATAMNELAGGGLSSVADRIDRSTGDGSGAGEQSR
jgi:hypothetical protein